MMGRATHKTRLVGCNTALFFPAYLFTGPSILPYTVLTEGMSTRQNHGNINRAAVRFKTNGTVQAPGLSYFS
jgi:hypothetical protein